MSKQTVILILLIIAAIAGILGVGAFIWVYRARSSYSPEITITPASGGPDTLIAVRGKGWKPGEEIRIMLTAPHSVASADDVYASTIADAEGEFSAYFIFPDDPRWSNLAQVWVVAQSLEGKLEATAWFRLERESVTPQPPPTPTPLYTATPTRLVLTGVAQQVDYQGGLIVVVSPEFGINHVVVTEKTRFEFTDGTHADLSQVHVQDQIEVLGYRNEAEALVAERITLLREPPSDLTPTQESTTTPTPLATSTPVPFTAWHGEYFANRSLSGNPSLTREDRDINFNWGQGSPAAGFPSDNFSVRWTAAWYMERGTYTFRILVDDGVRLWIDGELLIDQWRETALTEYSAEITLSDGVHEVRVEYFEAQGDAQIQVSWAYRSPYSGWKGEYFNGISLQGRPALVRDDPAVDFDWGEGSPAESVGVDQFSARWTRTLYLDAGNYRFFVNADDGVRLWIDDRLIIDEWHEAEPRIYFGDMTLMAGEHHFRIEYYEAYGQARISFWTETITDFPDWRGEYFDNPNLGGLPYFTRNDEEINFNWGGGSPGSGLPVDGFSVRWTRQVDFEGGMYRFHLTCDDGARLWLDGFPVMDQWMDGLTVDRNVARERSERGAAYGTTRLL